MTSPTDAVPSTNTEPVRTLALVRAPAAKSGIEAQIVLMWAQPIAAIDFYPNSSQQQQE